MVARKNLFGLPVTFTKQPTQKNQKDFRETDLVKEYMSTNTTTTSKKKTTTRGTTVTPLEESPSTPTEDKLEDIQERLILFHQVHYNSKNGVMYTSPVTPMVNVKDKKDDKKKNADVSPPPVVPTVVAPVVETKKFYYKVNPGGTTSILSSAPLVTDTVDKKQFEMVYWTTFKELAEDENIIDNFFVSNFSAMDLLYKLFYNPPIEKEESPKSIIAPRKKKVKALYSGQIITEQLEQLKDIYKYVTKLKWCAVVQDKDAKLVQNQKVHIERMNESESDSSSDSSDEDNNDIELVMNDQGEVDNIFSMQGLLDSLDAGLVEGMNKVVRGQRNFTINTEAVNNQEAMKEQISYLTVKDLENEDRFDLSSKITPDTKIEYYTIRNWLTKILASKVIREKGSTSDITQAFKSPKGTHLDISFASPVTATLLTMAEGDEEHDDDETSLLEDSAESYHHWKRKSVLRKGPLESDAPKMDMSPSELLDYMIALACSVSTLFDTLDEWETRLHALFAFLETLTLETPHQVNCILLFLGELIHYNQSLMSSEFIHDCLLPYLHSILRRPESIPFVDLFLKRIVERSQLLYIRDQAQRTINLALDNFSGNLFDSNFLKISSFQLSIQLTLIEFDLFSMMEPYEFYCSYWLSKKRFKVKTRDPSPNLSLFIQWYNTVSIWVTETILQYTDIKERHKALCRFISLAWGCYSVRNYNGCFEIISGLYSNEVYRLTKTWSMLSEEYLKKAQTLIDLTSVGNNYRNYREELKEAKKPCIPNIAVHLKDLASVDDSQEDERKLTEEEMRLLAENDQYCKKVFIGRTLDEDIEYNFSKRRLQATLICQLLKYQKTSYPFKANEPMKHYLWLCLLRINEDIRRNVEDKKITMEKYIQERKRLFLTRSKQLEPKSTR